MSPIEKIKAEARALRENEKSAGREMKHCDALEIIAQKHGYGSWRACLAILGKVEPSQGAAPVPERGSPLLDGESSAARETSFTRWMGPEMRQAAVDFSRNLGLFPIYAEASDQGIRYLFWQMAATASCEVRSGRQKETFDEFNRRNCEEGRKLLSLHISPQAQYSAVWISAEHYPPAVQFLARFGIGPVRQP